MPFYQYSVKNEHGETVKGRIDSPTKEQAAASLRNRSLLVISLRPMNDDPLADIKESVFGIKQDDIVNFTRQLATMITAGLTLTEALHILQQQSKPAMERMIGELLRDIEGGGSFAKALGAQGKKFSQVYVQLVRAGETAGALDTVLNRLAETLEKQREFSSKVKGALIYPVIVVIAMFIVGIIMMTFVIPKLTEMYKEFGAELPFVTQLLIDVSGIFASYWWLILGLSAGGSFAFYSWYKTVKGRLIFDTQMLRLPLLGPLRQKVVLTEFCRTMGLLLGSGISMLQALEILTAAIENRLYQNALKEAGQQVEKGVPLSQTITKFTYFPPILPQMIAVGEETGKIDEVLIKLSLYFEAESENEVKNLTAAFEPTIMIVLGIAVGILVVAIIMPIYNITANI